MEEERKWCCWIQQVKSAAACCAGCWWCFRVRGFLQRRCCESLKGTSMILMTLKARLPFCAYFFPFFLIKKQFNLIHRWCALWPLWMAQSAALWSMSTQTVRRRLSGCEETRVNKSDPVLLKMPHMHELNQLICGTFTQLISDSRELSKWKPLHHYTEKKSSDKLCLIKITFIGVINFKQH